MLDALEFRFYWTDKTNAESTKNNRSLVLYLTSTRLRIQCLVFLNHKRGQIDIICRSAWWKCQNEQRWFAFSDFRNRMWNLARSWNPLFFSRSNESRDTLRMLTRETVGLIWRPFAFWFEKKKKTQKMSLHGPCGACFGRCFPVEQLQQKRHIAQDWDVSILSQLGVVAGWVWSCFENKIMEKAIHPYVDGRKL